MWKSRPIVGSATLTIVMSMMFMNMADTNTTPTAIFWFIGATATFSFGFLSSGEASQGFVATRRLRPAVPHDPMRSPAPGWSCTPRSRTGADAGLRGLALPCDRGCGARGGEACNRPWASGQHAESRTAVLAGVVSARRSPAPHAGPGGGALPATPVEHGVAVPPGAGGRSVHRKPGRHRASAERGRPATAEPRHRRHAPLRLLLRVPDGVDRDDGQREPHRAAGRAGGGDGAGLSLLPGLQRVGAHVPPGHGGGSERGAATSRRSSPPRTPACCRRGRTISPTTTTADRSSSSGTRRARPC